MGYICVIHLIHYFTTYIKISFQTKSNMQTCILKCFEALTQHKRDGTAVFLEYTGTNVFTSV